MPMNRVSKSRMKQIERIERMERNLEQALHAIRGLNDALDDYETAQEALHELESYYGSETWKRDFADDEQGWLPSGLKRGVLSEDAIWNVLEDYGSIKERMKREVSV